MRRNSAIAFLVGILIAILLARHFLSHAPAALRTSPQWHGGTVGRTDSSPYSGALAPEILARAKAASVFIQVRSVSYLDEKEPTDSSGSGFLVSPDGRIVTNWHVVALYRDLQVMRLPYKQDRLEVILRPGTAQQSLHPATLIAARPEDDLALLKIAVQDMPCLELGESSGLVETTPVWVFGFPLGRVFSVLQRGPEVSVSHGCVSSLRHDDQGRLERIQFDATVSPGNSGGPVILSDGRVYAVANIAIGTSRINFGVPSERLRQLLAECPLDKNVGEKCRLRIASEPTGAEAFADGRLLGTTPLSTSLGGGRHYVQLRAAGCRTWNRMLTVYDEQTIEAHLVPAERLALRIVGQPAAHERDVRGTPAALARGASLYKEDFSRPQTMLRWDQDTGGSETRTWYAEDGMLHQWQDDGLLHAVFTGEAQWRDYAVSARVKIQPNERDGRAGLIFRATDDGFALFRLHRQTSKVQLAYHMKDPFGWQVLAERKLPFQVEGDHWYDMQVQATGERLLCLVDGAPVIEASLPQARLGRIGFYSVDSRASFDDALVTTIVPNTLAANDKAASGTPSAELQSFWFAESFQKQPSAWQASASWNPDTPWLVAEGACVQLDPKGHRMNLLECYDISDGSLSAVCTGAGGAIGLVFRREDKRCYVFEVTPGENLARLLALDGDKRSVLAATDDAKRVERALALGALAPENDTRERGKESARARVNLFVLNVIFQGKSIRAGVNADMLLEATDETLTHGSVGLYTDNARAAFLELRAGAPVEGP